MSGGKEAFNKYYKELPEEEKKKIAESLEKIALEYNKAVENLKKSVLSFFKGIHPSSITLSKEAKTFLDENKDVIDKVDEWEEITGLSSDELEQMEMWEVIALVRKNLNQPNELIELLDSVRPKKHIIPNNKLANSMTELTTDYNMIYELKVHSEKEVYSTISLNYNDENIQIYDKDKRFTSYDRVVHNAICSIYEAGNVNFTSDQVYRCMNGFDDQQYVSPQAVGAITKSLDKLTRINVKVDYTNEAKSYKKSVEKCIMEDRILAARKITLRAGGKEVTGYKLHAKPILYEYAQITNQVLTVPSKLLNTKDVINSSPQVIVIREYLIRRIEVMKRNKNQTNKITFEKIYYEIDDPEPTKRKAQKLRETIDILLNKFKTEKYIKDFKFYKEGRAFKGVEIIY